MSLSSAIGFDVNSFAPVLSRFISSLMRGSFFGVEVLTGTRTTLTEMPQKDLKPHLFHHLMAIQKFETQVKVLAVQVAPTAPRRHRALGTLLWIGCLG